MISISCRLLFSLIILRRRRCSHQRIFVSRTGFQLLKAALKSCFNELHDFNYRGVRFRRLIRLSLYADWFQTTYFHYIDADDYFISSRGDFAFLSWCNVTFAIFATPHYWCIWNIMISPHEILANIALYISRHSLIWLYHTSILKIRPVIEIIIYRLSINVSLNW